HYGIQRVEATLLALQSINADAALLPRLQLGAELRDSCWAPATALRQTIHLLREAIAPPDAPAAPSACSPVSSACRNTSQHKPVDQVQKQYNEYNYNECTIVSRDLVLCTNFHISGQSCLLAIALKMLWRLPRNRLMKDAVFLRHIAAKPSVCATANIADALQKRGSRNSALNALLK
ncbi:hypothetical protein B5X24_HaOG216253, partial [Helicoverpa armigera]